MQNVGQHDLLSNDHISCSRHSPFHIRNWRRPCPSPVLRDIRLAISPPEAANPYLRMVGHQGHCARSQHRRAARRAWLLELVAGAKHRCRWTTGELQHGYAWPRYSSPRTLELPEGFAHAYTQIFRIPVDRSGSNSYQASNTTCIRRSGLSHASLSPRRATRYWRTLVPIPHCLRTLESFSRLTSRCSATTSSITLLEQS